MIFFRPNATSDEKTSRDTFRRGRRDERARFFFFRSDYFRARRNFEAAPAVRRRSRSPIATVPYGFGDGLSREIVEIEIGPPEVCRNRLLKKSPISKPDLLENGRPNRNFSRKLFRRISEKSCKRNFFEPLRRRWNSKIFGNFRIRTFFREHYPS